ncbi:MAG TPA: SHOCT domain-containing protein [Opitutaceae bacterium]|nr:SHOCT domain-containing protein [Opitutaceae bacterium]
MQAKSTALPALLMTLALAFAGCVSSSTKLNSVHMGMPRSEVTAVLGAPTTTSTQANVEYLTYYLDNANGARDLPYMVRLVDGRVESFGRFIQLLDNDNHPLNRAAMGAIMPHTVNTDIVTQLQQLKLLKDQGVLNEDEFQRVKERLLRDND